MDFVIDDSKGESLLLAIDIGKMVSDQQVYLTRWRTSCHP